MAMAVVMQAGPVLGEQKKEIPTTSNRPGHQESARQHHN